MDIRIVGWVSASLIWRTFIGLPFRVAVLHIRKAVEENIATMMIVEMEVLVAATVTILTTRCEASIEQPETGREGHFWTDFGNQDGGIRNIEVEVGKRGGSSSVDKRIC